jgi:hypothetical protein
MDLGEGKGGRRKGKGRKGEGEKEKEEKVTEKEIIPLVVKTHGLILKKLSGQSKE